MFSIFSVKTQIKYKQSVLYRRLLICAAENNMC